MTDDFPYSISHRESQPLSRPSKVTSNSTSASSHDPSIRAKGAYTLKSTSLGLNPNSLLTSCVIDPGAQAVWRESVCPHPQTGAPPTPRRQPPAAVGSSSMSEGSRAERKKPQDGASLAWSSHMPSPGPSPRDRVVLCSDWPERPTCPSGGGVAAPPTPTWIGGCWPLGSPKAQLHRCPVTLTLSSGLLSLPGLPGLLFVK